MLISNNSMHESTFVLNICPCQEESTASLTREQQREVGEEVAYCAVNLLLIAAREQVISPTGDRRRLLQVIRFTFKVTTITVSDETRPVAN